MREYSRTVMLPMGAPLESVFEEMEALGVMDFRQEGLEGTAYRSADLRYSGQGYELNVPFGPEMAAQFHSLHQRHYGFANESRLLEVVNVRVRMVCPGEPFEQELEPPHEGSGEQAVIGARSVYFDGAFQKTRVYGRQLLRPGDTFAGPAIVSEYSSATVLPPGDLLRVDGLNNLVIEVH
jgi:N-methylhydantoinase A